MTQPCPGTCRQVRGQILRFKNSRNYGTAVLCQPSRFKHEKGGKYTPGHECLVTYEFEGKPAIGL
jgi:hypothetical protein